MKNNKNPKKLTTIMKLSENPKIIGGILTILVLSVLFFAGPTKAFILNLDSDKESLISGENITFTAKIDIEVMDKYLPVKKLQLDIIGPSPSMETEVCEFDVHGNIISGCEGMTITPILINLSEHRGYGEGYGQENSYGYSYGYEVKEYGYGYDFGYDYGYGYGYGAGGKEINLIYEITLDTSNDTTNYGVGEYESQLKALIGDKTFISKDKPEFTIISSGTIVLSGGGGTRISKTTLELLIGKNYDLIIGNVYTFEIYGEEHSLKITEIGTDYVWVIISSEPQKLKLDFGGATEIDLDGDGINDISLKIISIGNNKVGIEYYNLNDGSSGVVELTPSDDLGFSEMGDQQDQEPAQSFFSRITGAVTGTLGTAGSIVVIVFIVGILGSSIAVRSIRRRRRKIS